MNTDQWIESLAQRARLEIIPSAEVHVPRVAPATYRLPRMALSLSAIGSLAAACLLLAMGLNADRSTSASSWARSGAGTSDNSVTVLFAPLKIANQP